MEKTSENSLINQPGCEKETISIIQKSNKSTQFYEDWGTLENGNHYQGEVKNNMPNGMGDEYKKDEFQYSGQFFNGKWHGKGKINSRTAGEREGEFLNGYFCGI
jgi:hypothetical protein